MRRARGKLAGQIVAGHDDGRRLTVCMARHRRRPNQLAAGAQGSGVGGSTCPAAAWAAIRSATARE